MEKKLNYMGENDRKEYRPPRIEVVEVMVERGFDGGEGDLNTGIAIPEPYRE